MMDFRWETHRRDSGANFHIALSRDEFVRGFDMHGHLDMFEWVVVLSGEMSHSVNGFERLDRRGSVTLIRPGDRHRMSGASFTIVNVAFPQYWLGSFELLWGEPGLCAPLLKGKEPPRACLAEEDFSRVEAHLMKMLELGRGVEATQCFTAFFATLLSGPFKAFLAGAAHESKVGGGMPDWLSDTLAFVERSSGAPPSLEEMRRSSCKCAEHFAREFKRHLGCTPSEYLARLRLDKAANLLANTNYPVSEICGMSGFGNISHFCRLFKRRHGLSPRDYRNSRSVRKG